MLSYAWPVALIVIANIVYQVCTKEVPGTMDPFAALSVTYLVGTLASLALFFVFNRDGSLIQEYHKLNWAPFLLGGVIVCLEVGFIYAYKAGWDVSRLFIVQSAFIAVGLVFLGLMAYHEAITWNKALGVMICLVGLAVINLK